MCSLMSPTARFCGRVMKVGCKNGAGKAFRRLPPRTHSCQVHSFHVTKLPPPPPSPPRPTVLLHLFLKLSLMHAPQRTRARAWARASIHVAWRLPDLKLYRSPSPQPKPHLSYHGRRQSHTHTHTDTDTHAHHHPRRERRSHSVTSAAYPPRLTLSLKHLASQLPAPNPDMIVKFRSRDHCFHYLKTS